MDGELEQWFKETAHQIETLLAVTDRAQSALIGGPAAMRDCAAHLRRAGRDGMHWLEDHPCPEQDLGARLDRLCGRYRGMAERFGRDRVPGGGGEVAELTRDLGALSGDLAVFIAELQQRLEEA
jgi:hypothetical protein